MILEPMYISLSVPCIPAALRCASEFSLLKAGQCTQCKLYITEERTKIYLLIALVPVTNRLVLHIWDT